MLNQNQQISSRITLPLFTILLALCLILAACGPAPTEAPAATEPPATEAPATEAPATEAPVSTEPPATEEPPTAEPATQTPAPVELPVTDCSSLLPPENCNPDWIGGIIYKPLAELPAGECEIRLLDAGVGQCSTVTYTDDIGQVFTITVEGAEASAVQDYLGEAAAYFTVQQVGSGVTPPTDLNFPSLPAILVETATEFTGRSQEELRIIRDDLIAERGGDANSVTFADVIRAVPSDPDEILRAATDRAISEFTSAGQAAGLSQEEIDTLINSLPEELNALMNAPGAWFLVETAETPQDDTAYAAFLMDHPEAIVITLDWASMSTQEPDNLWLVGFAIDPSIGPFGYHYYKEKCNIWSASVRISATGGSMTDYFWRRYPYYYSVGSRTADIQTNPSPSGMSHSSYPNIRSYDTYVKGGPNGGTYYIYGGWVQGYGCQ